MHAVAAFFASIIAFVSGFFAPAVASNSPVDVRTAQPAAAAAVQTETASNPFNDAAAASAVAAAIPAIVPASAFSPPPAPTVINQPVVERIIERIVPQGGTISADTLSAILADFERSISSRIAAINPPKAEIPEHVAAAGYSSSYYFAPASQRIDQISNTTINNPTISGGSISGTSITGTITNAIDTALGTIGDLTSNTVTATNVTFANATTTNLAVTNLTASATSTLSGLKLAATDCSAYGNGGKLTTDAFGMVVCAADQGGAGGTIGGLDAQVQFNDGGVFGGNAGFTYDKTAQRVAVAYASTTGITANYASSTTGFFGTLSAGSLALTTPLSVVNGGTGIGNPASAGILVGSYGGGSWQQLATSSLGLLTSDIAEGSNLYFTNNRVAGVIAGTTTDALSEGSTRLYFTNARVQTYLDTLAKGYFFSTTSTDYWKGVTSFFSTSSTDYWKSQNSFFSTTSVAYWEATQARWATTSADYWKTQTAFTGASTTLLADRNTWTVLNTFSNTSTTLATLGNAWFTGITSSRLLALDENGKLAATTTIGTNLLAGVLSVSKGGTGTSTNAAYGNVLAWNGSNYQGFATSTLGLSTTNILEGANLYFTNARADQRINATSTIGTLTSAPNLATISTSLTGFLKATAGALSTSLINLASDITGTLGVANGGTGWASIAAGAIPYGNGSSALATTSAASGGQVLAFLNGVPTWTATTTFSAPLSYANGAVSLAQANSGTNGYLAAADWTLFNGKISSSSLSAVYPLAYNSATGIFSTAFSTTTNNTFSGTNVFNGQTTLSNASTTNLTASGTGTWFSGLTSGLLSTDTNGKLVATTSVGVNYLTGTLGVANGGTGATSFGQGWLYSTGGTGALAASTSPTINYLISTSTTATSTFAGKLIVSGRFGLDGLFSSLNTTGMNRFGELGIMYASTTNNSPTPSGATNTYGGFFNMNNSSNAVTGNQAALGSSILVNSAAAAGAGTFFAGYNGYAWTDVNVGGTPGSPKGSLFGAASAAILGSNASNWFAVTGAQFNVTVGTSTNFVAAVLAARESAADTTRGTVTDAAFAVSKGSASQTWAHGLLFTNASGGFPFDNTSTAVGFAGSGAVNYVLDANGITVNSAVLRGPNSSSLIDGSGNATFLSASTTNGYIQDGYRILYASSSVETLAVGASALAANTTGTFNTAVGRNAIFSNTSGGSNTALGVNALYFNTTGTTNTAAGLNALFFNESATSTTAFGYIAGQGLGAYHNQGSTYVGFSAGFSAGNGSDYNSFLGYAAGYDVTTGQSNTILGQFPTIGVGVTSGSGNILIGNDVRSGLNRTGSNQLNIGNLIFGTGLGSSATLATGNIGIGTSTPWGKLSITGSGTGSGLAFAVADSANTPRFVIQDNGNVGVGTTTPTSLLEVGNSTAGSNRIYLTNTHSGGASYAEISTRNGYAATDAMRLLAMGTGWSTSGAFVQDAGVVDADATLSGGLSIAALAAGSTMRFYTSGHNERMRIDSAGNVGVGTSTPWGKLSITGSGTGTGLAFAVADSANTPRLVIKDNGNVGIGTTTPAYTLDVKGFINTDGTAGGYKLAGNTILYASTTNSTFAAGASSASAWMSASSTLWNNVAVGIGALATAPTSPLTAYSTSPNNTAIGVNALGANRNGFWNVAVGYNALAANVDGGASVAIGHEALMNYTDVEGGIAIGNQALRAATSSLANIAIGNTALYNLTSGGGINIAIGHHAFFDATNAGGNVGIGYITGYDITSGSFNTFLGHDTGRGITTGSYNTILGAQVSGLSQTLSNNIILADGVGTIRAQVDSSGNFGIGTTTPWGKLSIKGSGTGTGLALAVADSANTPRFVIQDNGNVGIGTTSPSQLLSIAGNGYFTGQMFGNPSDSVSSPSFSWASDATTGWYRPASSQVGLTLGGTNLLTFANSGSTWTAPSTNSGANFVALTLGGAQSVANTGNYYSMNVNPTYTAAAGNTLTGLVGAQFNPRNTNTGTVTAIWGVTSQPQNTSSGIVGTMYGVSSAPQNTSTGTTTTMVGLYSIPSNASAGTTTLMYGLLSQPRASAGSVSTMYGAYVDCGAGGASAVISTCYGLRIGSFARTGTVTTSYGLYQDDTLAKNYFGGNVGIGVMSPATLLEVASGTPSIIDSSAWSKTVLGRFNTNLNSSTTQFGINIEAQVTGDTGAPSNYEKAALIVWARSADPSITNDRDIVGIDTRGTIAATNPMGRAWGFITAASIESGGDGLLSGAEIDVTNRGSDQPLVATSTSKVGLQIVSLANPITAGLVFAGVQPSTFHKGIYMNPAYLAASTSDSFIELLDRFIVKPSGAVGIGTSTPWGKLSITGSGTGSGLAFAVADSANTPRFVIQDNGNVGVGTTSPTAQLHTTGTVRFSNFGSGTLTTDASGNLSVSSDERLKNIDGVFNRGLADIVKLSPIQYHWNATSGLDTSTQYAGFSAQNVQTAIPEAVGSSTSGYLSLQDRPIIAAVVNAIKELAQQVGNLAERVVTKEIVAVNGSFRRVNTGELCVDDICVTREQFAAMVAAAGQTTVSPSPASVGTHQAPVIELNGNASSTIELGDTYNDLGARIVAPDSDLNLGIVILLDGVTTTAVSIDTSTPGEHSILYSVTSPTTGLTGRAMRTVIISPAGAPPAPEEENNPFNSQPANDNASSTPAVDAAA